MYLFFSDLVHTACKAACSRHGLMVLWAGSHACAMLAILKFWAEYMYVFSFYFSAAVFLLTSFYAMVQTSVITTASEDWGRGVFTSYIFFPISSFRAVCADTTEQDDRVIRWQLYERNSMFHAYMKRYFFVTILTSSYKIQIILSTS